MKRAFLRDHGKSGIAMIEEATALLRTCPPSIFATYLVGTVPFAVGLLVFISHLGRHANAGDHLAIATFVMTALFLWLKYFQGRYCHLLLARLRGVEPVRPGVVPATRSICLQTILHATGLVIVPIAMVATIPFGWVTAFYQNVTVLDDGSRREGELIRDAARLSRLWPGQNHSLLVISTLLGFFVFLNWISLGFFVPRLVEMLFGIESVFTQSPWSMLNLTFFSVVIALTYLTVDPLMKACYTLRCFYGESLRSGDDLKSDVRRLSGRAAALAGAILLASFAPRATAAETSPPPAEAITSQELDQSIDRVVQQEKYTWRDPRAKPPEENGALMSFVKSVRAAVKNFFRAIGDFLERIEDWFRSRDRRNPDPGNASGGPILPRVLLYGAIIIVAAALAIAVVQMLRARRAAAESQEAVAVVVPDVESENTMADELPEDDWTRLGRQFLERGELRLAVRSFHLASLAHLASTGLVTIARSKSNRDYERELRRRGHGNAELPLVFGENVGTFDRVWYGRHEVDRDAVQHFIGNLEKMKGAA